MAIKHKDYLEDIELRDLVDANVIRDIMNDFYKLTGLGIGIIDTKGNVLVAIGWQDICTKFHRVNKDTCKNCIDSDTQMNRGLSRGVITQYKCKNNMWDIMTPIMLHDKHIGNICHGQFFYEDEKIDYEFFSNVADKHNFNKEEYMSALKKVPIRKRETIETLMKFHIKLSNLIAEMSHRNIMLSNTIAQVKTSQEKIQKYNIDMITAYNQLEASEEELRAQYEEIQNYSKEIQDLQKKYELAIQTANSALWEYDIKNKELVASHEFYEMIGVPYKDNNIEDVLLKILDTKELLKIEGQFEDYCNGRIEEIHCDIKINIYENIEKYFLIRGKGIYDNKGTLTNISGLFMDITKDKKQEQQIEYLAYYDKLTSLPNHKSFLNRMRSSLKNNKSGAIIIVDIDNFKNVNDTLGHKFGDKVLKRVAKELICCSKERVFVSRSSGDEFLILLEDINSKEDIEKFAEKVKETFNKGFKIENKEIYISCSMGISMYPDDSIKIGQLVMNADIALFKTKREGKNHYSFFNYEMMLRLKRRVRIEHILRTAIEGDGFEILFQPQVCTRTLRAIAFEALLRLKNSDVSPNEFIPVAEDTGLIIKIGRIVTKKVIHTIGELLKEGKPVKPISINFSVVQLRDADYVVFLKKELKKNNVPPSLLEIEITESVFCRKRAGCSGFFKRIKSNWHKYCAR